MCLLTGSKQKMEGAKKMCNRQTFSESSEFEVARPPGKNQQRRLLG